jgi:hypothetical protein
MIDHLLPPWLFGRDARDDLTLIFAFLAALVPGLVWLVRRWTTRLTVRFSDGTTRLTVTGIGDHPLRLVVNARKKDLLYKLNVACLERDWGRYKRAPVNAVRLRDIFDEGDPMDRLQHDDGSVTARYPAIAKGSRPIGLTMVLIASQPWCGWLSVRDDATNRTGRVRLRVVPGDPPAPF